MQDGLRENGLISSKSIYLILVSMFLPLVGGGEKRLRASHSSAQFCL